MRRWRSALCATWRGGIGASAHRGTAAVHGRAVGMLGTGMDLYDPKEKKRLYEQVLEHGATISEFPIGTHPAPENFPIRNRIIAGIPSGVLIVEGAQYSRSLITARLAMGFGREVFIAPSHVTHPASFAPNLLIKQDAKLVTSAEDVIEDLPMPIRAALSTLEQPESEERNRSLSATLTGAEKKIYELLSAEEPRQIDYIVEQSGLNSSEVLGYAV